MVIPTRTIAILVFAGCLSAQSTATRNIVTVPKWEPIDEVQEGMCGSFAHGMFHPMRIQALYSTKDIPYLVGRISGMEFRPRRTPMRRYPYPRTTFRMDVSLSVGPRTPASASLTYASNHGGAVPTRVFSGTVTWPAVSPYETPEFVAAVPFQRAFAYVGPSGKSLVVDTSVRWSNLGAGTWRFGIATKDLGWSWVHFRNNGSCGKFRGNVWTNDPLVPGATVRWFIRGVPARSLVFGGFGFVGAPEYWGGKSLPIYLGHNCFLNIGPAVWFAAFADKSNMAYLPLQVIPRDRRWQGVALFAQAMWPKQSAPLGFVVGNSAEARIGSGSAPDASYLDSSINTTNRPRGDRLYRTQAPVLRLHFQ